MVGQARQQPIELATHVPRLPRAYVPRARLWARLDVATESTLTLLVGPGGSGKTLGVSGWLRRSASPRSPAGCTQTPRGDRTASLRSCSGRRATEGHGCW